VGRLTLSFFLVPVLGLGIAALAFGETLGPLEGTGVTLMLAGSARWRGSRGTAGRAPMLGHNPHADPPVITFDLCSSRNPQR